MGPVFDYRRCTAGKDFAEGGVLGDRPHLKVAQISGRDCHGQADAHPDDPAAQCGAVHHLLHRPFDCAEHSGDGRAAEQPAHHRGRRQPCHRLWRAEPGQGRHLGDVHDLRKPVFGRGLHQDRRRGGDGGGHRHAGDLSALGQGRPDHHSQRQHHPGHQLQQGQRGGVGDAADLL